jgi:hypothetical protein
MAAGRAAAIESHISNPTAMQIASYGFLAAARLDPMYIRSKRAIAAVIKSALFTSESTSRLTKTQLRNVAGHVGASLQEHLSNPRKSNIKWIEDRDLNLLNFLAARVNLSKEQIRHALTELGWQAFQTVGKCIDTQMRAFRDSIPTPLTKIEHLYFYEQFLSNSNFAGLPLLLLLDRFSEFQAAVVNVWNNVGDRNAVAVFHRAIAYIGETLANRRTADREYKRESLARNEDGEVARKFTEYVQFVAQPNTVEDRFILQIAKHLAALQQIDCEFGEWEAEVQSSKPSVHIVLRRAEPEFVKHFKISRPEFDALARRIQQGDM